MIGCSVRFGRLLPSLIWLQRVLRGLSRLARELLNAINFWLYEMLVNIVAKIAKQLRSGNVGDWVFFGLGNVVLGVGW